MKRSLVVFGLALALGCSRSSHTDSESVHGRMHIAYDIQLLLVDEWWRHSKWPTSFSEIEARFRAKDTFNETELDPSATVRWELKPPTLPSASLPHQKRLLKVYITSASGHTTSDTFELELYTKESAHVHVDSKLRVDPDPGNLANIYAGALHHHPNGGANLRQMQGLLLASYESEKREFVRLGGFEKLAVLEWEERIRLRDPKTETCYTYPAWVDWKVEGVRTAAHFPKSEVPADKLNPHFP